jgi:hypothetical protein
MVVSVRPQHGSFADHSIYCSEIEYGEKAHVLEFIDVHEPGCCNGNSGFSSGFPDIPSCTSRNRGVSSRYLFKVGHLYGL